jgi:murein DD-endopeptidase MepM/ murein hydrolase activator NlpD
MNCKRSVMKLKILFTASGFILLSTASLAQTTALSESGGEYVFNNNSTIPCLREDQYLQIKKNCDENIKQLNLNTASVSASTSLTWPLQAAQGFSDCGFYFISAHVDHDAAATTFADYNCGNITYDGHKGTDIALWPYPFYKMDNNQVEVIAAAAGIIVDKHDGEFDKNCVGVGSNLTPNYIVIQHADSSRALYLHMKKNSLTGKTIGQSVASGEYLGIVGSSGSSSGPHLHFEIWAGSTVSTVNDPFSGTCNLLNNTSWWAAQKPYTEQAVLKASCNTTDVVLPPCPGTETSNETDTFAIPFQGAGLPAGYAKFYIFLRNETTGTSVDMKILNPNSSVYLSWTHACNNTVNASYWTWTKLLPTIPGNYTFQATYNNITCSKVFTIVSSTGIEENISNDIMLLPNPFSTSAQLEFKHEVINGEVMLFDAYGRLLRTVYNVTGKTFRLNREDLVAGIYLLKVIENNRSLGTFRAILE